jgi:hypothetical protein
MPAKSRKGKKGPSLVNGQTHSKSQKRAAAARRKKAKETSLPDPRQAKIPGTGPVTPDKSMMKKKAMKVEKPPKPEKNAPIVVAAPSVGPAAVNPDNAGLSAPVKKSNPDLVREAVDKYLAQRFPGRDDFAATVTNVRQSNTAATPVAPNPLANEAGVEEAMIVDPETDEEIRIRNNRGRWQFLNGFGEHTGVEMDTDQAVNYMQRFDEDSQRKAYQVMRVDVPLPQRDPSGYVTPEELQVGRSGTLQEHWERLKKEMDDEAEFGRKIKLSDPNAPELRIGRDYWKLGSERKEGLPSQQDLASVQGLSDEMKTKILSSKKLPRVHKLTRDGITYLPYSYKVDDKSFTTYEGLKNYLEKEKKQPVGYRRDIQDMRASLKQTEESNDVVRRKLIKIRDADEAILKKLAAEKKQAVLKQMDKTVEVIQAPKGAPHLIEANRHGLKVQIGETDPRTYKTIEELNQGLRENDQLTDKQKEQVRELFKKRETYIDDKLKESGHKKWEDWAKADAVKKALIKDDPIKGIQKKQEAKTTLIHYKNKKVEENMKNLADDQPWYKRVLHPDNVDEMLNMADRYMDIGYRSGELFHRANVGVGQAQGYLRNMAKYRILQINKQTQEIDHKLKKQDLKKEEREDLLNERRHLVAEAVKQRQIESLGSDEKIRDIKASHDLAVKSRRLTDIGMDEKIRAAVDINAMAARQRTLDSMTMEEKIAAQAAAEALNRQVRREAEDELRNRAELFNRTGQFRRTATVDDNYGDMQSIHNRRHGFFGRMWHGARNFFSYYLGGKNVDKVMEGVKEHGATVFANMATAGITKAADAAGEKIGIGKVGKADSGSQTGARSNTGGARASTGTGTGGGASGDGGGASGGQPAAGSNPTGGSATEFTPLNNQESTLKTIGKGVAISLATAAAGMAIRKGLAARAAFFVGGPAGSAAAAAMP